MKCPYLIDRTVDIKKSKSSTGRYEYIHVNNVYEFKECLKYDCPFFRFINSSDSHGNEVIYEKCLRGDNNDNLS